MTKDKDFAMTTIQVFDKPMCCSTGVCGPQVDPVLPRFAADLAWLKGQGHSVERFNLAQQPAAFTENRDVRQAIEAQGTDCLPLILVDGQIVSRGEYPLRDTLSLWASTESSPPLLVVQPANTCCGGSGCC
jgi:hypothetical protein